MKKIEVITDNHLNDNLAYFIDTESIVIRRPLIKELPWYVRAILKFKRSQISWNNLQKFKQWNGNYYYE